MYEPYLKDFPIYDGLSCDQASRLDQAVVERTYAPRSLIFQASERADYIYLIRSGRVKLYCLTEDGREQTIAILCSGDVFGELLMGEGLTHSVFAEAFDEALVCILARENFFRLLLQEPLIALTIIHNIGVRLRLDADSIENLGTYDAAQRLGKVLLRLAAQFGEGPPDKTRLHVRFTHRDMADIAAMSRQTVTTQLGHFRRIGLVSRKGPYLVVNVRHLSDYIYVRSLQQDEGDTSTDRQGATLR